ncbi:integrase [Sesbania bispinosa]|nr:integrase [Sesbania bispinosa]
MAPSSSMLGENGFIDCQRGQSPPPASTTTHIYIKYEPVQHHVILSQPYKYCTSELKMSYPPPVF